MAAAFRLATVLAAVLAISPAAAQLTEEVLQVPTSRETREAAEAEAERLIEEAPAEAAEPGAWREIAAPYDIERIEQNEKAYGEALLIAEEAGSPTDQAELRQMLGTLPEPIAPDDLVGRWQCRTVRIDADPARLAVYDWYDCQISQLSRGLLLEKLGGSELTNGLLYPDESDSRLIYLGYRHGRAEPARDYDGAGGPEGADPANRDDPGVLTRRGEDRLLLAKPYPTIDQADYDWLELRRN